MRTGERALAAIGLAVYVAGSAACASSGDTGGDVDAGDCVDCVALDAGSHDARVTRDASAGADAATSVDASDGSISFGDAGAFDGGAFDAGAFDGNAFDASAFDTSTPDTSTPDASAPDTSTPDSAIGPITGGPCRSGAAGATAYRVHFIDAGGQAQAVYDVDGLPDRSRDHTEAYGYQIGFTSQYVDPFLAQGGLQLDSSDFVDIEFSTAGLSSIQSATLSIYGRSFDTTTSGSFDWQTNAGTGSAPTDLVSNVAPYAWYSADMTTEMPAATSGALLRIKAGPSSGVLVVNAIEICMQAN
jgi:hypothetical protein